MNPQRIIIAVLGLSAIVVVGFLFFAPHLKHRDVLTGYIEGEPLYLSSPVSGTLTRLDVRRGDQAAAGQVLFAVDPRQLEAAAGQARSELTAARAQAADARKGQRPVELAVLDAEVASAEAQVRDAEATYRRIATLTAKGIYAPARLDDARAQRDAATAGLAAARRRRDAATLGARDDQVRAADARVSQAGAGVTAAEARASDLTPRAPAAARVEDVFFQTGEWVAANQPIVALQTPERISVRFFVPERAASAYRVGRRVAFACDGCVAGQSAVITYVSPRPEFTPPVIYSLSSRDRLVFMVEARPDHVERLVPGLPVDVTPLATDGQP